MEQCQKWREWCQKGTVPRGYGARWVGALRVQCQKGRCHEDTVPVGYSARRVWSQEGTVPDEYSARRRVRLQRKSKVSEGRIQQHWMMQYQSSE